MPTILGHLRQAYSKVLSTSINGCHDKITIWTLVGISGQSLIDLFIQLLLLPFYSHGPGFLELYLVKILQGISSKRAVST